MCLWASEGFVSCVDLTVSLWWQREDDSSGVEEVEAGQQQNHAPFSHSFPHTHPTGSSHFFHFATYLGKISSSALQWQSVNPVAGRLTPSRVIAKIVKMVPIGSLLDSLFRVGTGGVRSANHSWAQSCCWPPLTQDMMVKFGRQILHPSGCDNHLEFNFIKKKRQNNILEQASFCLTSQHWTKQCKLY